jgi:hypothetical protein
MQQCWKWGYSTVRISVDVPRLAVVIAIVVMIAFSSVARAQNYDPCQPARPGNVLDVIISQVNAAQRAQACQQAREAAWRQQQAAVAAQQAREAEALRAAARARVEAETQARAAAAQEAAETSLDNFCHEPDTARHLISEYNGMDWQGSERRQVVDIEHLVTIRRDATAATLVCHGIWVHTNSARIEGTMTMHPNVAGDIIVSWRAEHWHPPVPIVAPLTPSPQSSISVTTRASATSTAKGGPPADEQSPGYLDGRADRLAWEQWFGSLAGDTRLGAEYWTGERHKARPGNCVGTPEFQQGCGAATQRLATPDVRRKTEPQYWWGWNSL